MRLGSSPASSCDRHAVRIHRPAGPGYAVTLAMEDLSGSLRPRWRSSGSPTAAGSPTRPCAAGPGDRVLVDAAVHHASGLAAALSGSWHEPAPRPRESDDLAALAADLGVRPGPNVRALPASEVRAQLATTPSALGVLRAEDVTPRVRALQVDGVTLFGGNRVRDLRRLAAARRGASRLASPHVRPGRGLDADGWRRRDAGPHRLQAGDPGGSRGRLPVERRSREGHRARSAVAGRGCASSGRSGSGPPVPYGRSSGERTSPS